MIAKPYDGLEQTEAGADRRSEHEVVGQPQLSPGAQVQSGDYERCDLDDLLDEGVDGIAGSGHDVEDRGACDAGHDPGVQVLQNDGQDATAVHADSDTEQDRSEPNRSSE